MKSWLKRGVVLVGGLGLLAVLFLEGLRFSATRQGVSAVAIPSGSKIAELAATADYTDAYRIQVKESGLRGTDVRSLAFQQGREVARTDNEIVFEGRAPGLRFLAAYLLEPVQDGSQQSQLTMSTAVFYESGWGRLYFLPVGVGHRRLVPFALSRIVQDLPSSETSDSVPE